MRQGVWQEAWQGVWLDYHQWMRSYDRPVSRRWDLNKVGTCEEEKNIKIFIIYICNSLVKSIWVFSKRFIKPSLTKSTIQRYATTSCHGNRQLVDMSLRINSLTTEHVWLRFMEMRSWWCHYITEDIQYWNTTKRQNGRMGIWGLGEWKYGIFGMCPTHKEIVSLPSP